MDDVNNVGSVIFTCAAAKQPFASVTLTLYVPASKLDTFGNIVVPGGASYQS